MKKIAVIVVTYNGMNWINKCIQSILHSSVKLWPVFIDNGSSDGTQAAIQQHKEIKFMQAKKNVGFAKANNVGIKWALQQQCDYVFLLNQDAWIENNTIEQLLKTVDEFPGYGIISPMHLNGSYTALDIKFANYLIPENCKNIVSDMSLNKLKPVYEAVFVNAAAWLIPVSCIQKTGLLETRFFFYGEDSNYLQRVQYHGFKTGIATTCTICHDREARQGKLNISNYYKWQLSEALVILLNINRSFESSISLFFKEQFRSAAKHLLEGKFAMLQYPVRLMLYFLVNITSLKALRKSYMKGFN